MADNNSERVSTVSCVACGSSIPEGVSICVACNSYQSRWRNSLTYTASIAGFFALIASAAAFVFSNLSGAIKEAQWHDEVGIGQLDYPGSVLLVNSGDGDVFVSDINFYWLDGSANTGLSINKVVKPKNFESIKLVYSDTRQKFDSAQSPRYSIEGKSLVWIRSGDGVASEKVIDESMPNRGGKCVLYSFFTETSPRIVRMSNFFKSHNMQLVTLPVKVEVVSISAHSGKFFKSEVNNVKMGFLFDASAGCTQSEWLQ
jgi:hypothetical protein